MFGEEVWQTVGDCWDYEVSDQGRVRNKKTGRILKTFTNGSTEQVTMSDHGFRLTRSVSSLVLQAFKS
jgi:hypothetical protein